MGWGNESLFKLNGSVHVTKMATMPIYDYNPLKIFSRTSGPVTFKLGMQHWGLGPYKVCSNEDPWLTLTYFMVRSSLLPYAFVWDNTLLQ